MKYIFIFLIAIGIVVFSGCSSDESKDNINIVVDEAGFFDKNDELAQQYRDFNKYLLIDFDIDFRVLITSSQEDVNIFTNERFNEIESRSSSGKTILLLINTAQDLTRVEVSMALEHIYTDAFVSYIERKGMVPYFRDSKVADGIFMMSELVRDRATEARDGAEFVAPMKSKSIGAGAKNDAKIGQKNIDAKKGRDVKSSGSDTLKDVLEKYLKSLAEHNKNPNLDIFTQDTQKFFSSWTVTDINQDNELRFTSTCRDGKFYTSYDKYAVLVHPLKPRTCCPYFFKKEDNVWKIDIATMAKTILFNKDMKWHFNMKEKVKYLSDYEFAFQNLKCDKNGFPYYKQRKKSKLRWGYQCSHWTMPNEPRKQRCYISWLDQDARAKNELGLLEYDRVMAYGNGSTRVNNPTQDEFMDYLKFAPSGMKVYVSVIREEKLLELNTVAP